MTDWGQNAFEHNELKSLVFSLAKLLFFFSSAINNGKTFSIWKHHDLCISLFQFFAEFGWNMQYSIYGFINISKVTDPSLDLWEQTATRGRPSPIKVSLENDKQILCSMKLVI